MSFFAKIISVVGLVLLVHAGYSAHEHSALHSHHQSSTASSSAGSISSVPLDIQLETLVAMTLLAFGIVLGAEALKPITWSRWAGNIEKEGGQGNPFRQMEERPGFLDIRAARKEFADWIRDKDTIVKS